MDYESFAGELAARAKRAGADEADVLLQTSTDFGVQVRRGEIETLTQAASKSLGLRIFVDRRLGFASTSDFSKEATDRLLETAVALARFADSREENGLPEPIENPTFPDLCLDDPDLANVGAETKIAYAKRCEAAMFATDPRITNSEGAGYGDSSGQTVLANSRGLVASYRKTGCSLYAQPLAEENGKKQVDYEWSYRRRFADLESPESVGRKAAERALRKLGAHKAPTQIAPVVFERRIASRIWSGVLAALNGDSVFKGMSYLRDQLGETIASEAVTLIDDGTLIGGAGSSPFDGEGLPTRRNVLIENGVLKTYLYDTATAKKVGNGTRSTSNYRRSAGSVGGIGAFNLYLQAGEWTPEAILAEVQSGFLVTDMMGGGANPVTGDFSIGASGLWIENGEIIHAVEEVTLAGSMASILKGISQVANDLEFQSSVVSPTFRVDALTIGGA